MTLDHKTSHKSHRYICSNSQQYIVWFKIVDFYFMEKITRILNTYFLLLICIAKDLVWTTLKAIFSVFRF